MKSLLLFLISTSIFAKTEIYLLNTKIGGRVFKDILILESEREHELSGTLTVPGIFTTKALNIKLNKEFLNQEIKFEISTLENNRPLNGVYQVFSNDQFKSLKGSLSIGDEQFEIFGEKLYEK